MARDISTGPLMEVQLTFTIPERVLNWAVAQAAKQKVRDVDHVIAILVSAHREAKVVSVKLPKGERESDSVSVVGGGSKKSVG